MKKSFLTIALFILIGITSNLLSQEPQVKTSYLSFKEMTNNFGNIKEVNGAVTGTFEFTNIAKTPITIAIQTGWLTISSIKATCGCTTPDWTKEPIAPGKNGYIKATYNPTNRPGKFSKSITVSTSTGETIILKIEGNVEPKPVETPISQ